MFGNGAPGSVSFGAGEPEITAGATYFQNLSGSVNFGPPAIIGQLYLGQFVLGQTHSQGVPAPTLTLQVQRTLTGSLVPTGSLDGLRVRLQSLAGALIPIGLLYKRTSRTLQGVLAPSGTFRKTFNRLLQGVLNPIGVLTRQGSFKRLLQGVINPIGNLRYVDAAQTFIYINNVEWPIEYDTLEIEDVLNEEPNQATFQTRVAPIEGQTIVITRGPQQFMEFAGNILSVRQSTQERPVNLLYDVVAQDYTWKLNRRLVTKRWRDVSASTIAEEIRTGFTTGFTGNNIVAGLPIIEDFECILETVSSAYDRLATEIAGNFYVDYGDKRTGALPDIHFFITETLNAPDDFTPAYPGADLVYDKNISQLRTRVAGVGKGSSALEEMVGATLPLGNVEMFEFSGQFLSGPNIGSFTGKHCGGTATTVGGNAVTPLSGPGAGAPTAAITLNDVGVLEGIYKYKVAYSDGSGETVPGAESNPVTGVAFAPPGAATIIAGALGRLLGFREYVVTFVNALGETIGGTPFSRTALPISIPSTPSIAVLDTGVNTDIGNLIGDYKYKTVIGSDLGFGYSLPSLEGTRTAFPQVLPNAPTVDTTAASCANGPLRVGLNYKWKVSFLASNGRETLGVVSSIVTPTATVAVAPSIPAGIGTGNQIKLRVAWRSKYGESTWSSITTSTNHPDPITVVPTSIPDDVDEWIIFSTGSYGAVTPPTDFYRMPDIHQGTGSDLFVDPFFVGVLTASSDGTMGKKANLTNIQQGPTGTIARRIYRTKGDGTEFFLVGEISNNDGTATWTDSVPDDSLTVAAPIQNLNGEQHTVTIGTSPAGTFRDIYRTEAYGLVFYFLKRVPDNTTPSIVDNATDAELNKSMTPPTVATLGEQNSLQFIPTPPIGSGVVARNIYRNTLAEPAAYRFLTQIQLAGITTFIDNVADADLGEYVPLINTAGANKITVDNLPVGPAYVTKRVLYRTTAGGSLFKYVSTIDNNTPGVSFIDNIPDDSLGREALTVGTVGVTFGSTELDLDSTVGFPLSGWISVGGQLIYYGGISGNTLLGIPVGSVVSSITPIVGSDIAVAATANAGFITGGSVTIQGSVEPVYNGRHENVIVSGGVVFDITGSPGFDANPNMMAFPPGAIQNAIAGGTPVISLPFLSGVSGVSYIIQAGQAVSLYTVRNDTAAQIAFGVIEGGDGIHEFHIADESIETLDDLNLACDTELNANKVSLKATSFNSRDFKLRSGKTVVVNRSPVSGSFLLQRVISTQFNRSRRTLPLRSIEAAPFRLSWQDVLKRKKQNTL